MRLTRWVVVVGVVMLLGSGAWAGRGVLHAQAGQAQVESQRAEDVRRELQRVLDRLPPALGVVLKSDPTLMTNAAYLAAYPSLAQYLTAHPEIPRDPAYFLEHIVAGRARPDDLMTPQDRLRSEAIRMWQNAMESFFFLCGFALAFLTVAWIIRYVVDHRRWLRATRIQSDVHGRLLERFSSGEELAAYMQSPAGAQFLQAVPLSMESGSRRAPGAPFNRILWSAQAGVVLVAAGIGFLFIQRSMVEEVAQIMGAWGTFAIAVGLGFVISGGVSYVISAKMGLLDESRE
jgi:hypothetical protein